ncbi:MAG: SDR family NAD(P)-dependent oxidoreductase [Zhengella sp.]|uniref:SDR family NAD(P)-dependent oxidoreductase n=1 Tax=Zhengella sp. TaxID=2282762 RepID=UPI001D3ABD00|nr:SDR family NAD(P)-dependent oxidoreductase [Notoacmeibacter sp.]MCC0026512.1 SDR family NAD(P)-dependent oxidoreductase [Brucellaceae bacterium]
MSRAGTERPRALVTGASSGLGRAFADLLELRGFDVVVLDRQEPDGEACERLHITCDLADRDALDRTLPVIFAAGPYDCVLLNAGISATGRLATMPPDVLLRIVRVNAEAPMVLAAALLRDRAVAAGGHMGFVSSLSHFTGYPGAAAYAGSKDALAVYARSLRKPAARLGVSVSAIFPGPLDTPQAARHAPAGADASRRMPAPVAARIILDGMQKGRRAIVPGGAPRLYAGLGRLFPGAMTAAMRRIIFEKLDRDTW